MSITCAHPLYRDWQLQAAAAAHLLKRKHEALLSSQGRAYYKDLVQEGFGVWAGDRACDQLEADQELAQLIKCDEKKHDTLAYLEDLLLDAEFGAGCLRTVLDWILCEFPEREEEVAKVVDDAGLAHDDALPGWFTTSLHARVEQWLDIGKGWNTPVACGVPQLWLEAVLIHQLKTDGVECRLNTIKLDSGERDLNYVTQPLMPPGITNLRATPRRPGAPSGLLPH